MNNQPKHTPGPWVASFHAATGNCVIADNEKLNARNSIAVCYGPDATPNTQLIAAAPELLEWIEAALPYLEHPEVLAIPFALSPKVLVENGYKLVNKAKGGQ